jgi:hypothetical protein
MARHLRWFAAFALLLVGFAVTPNASGQTDNYQGCGAVLSDVSVEPGQTITVSGNGAAPNTEVSATLDGTVIGTGTADASGVYSFEATIPQNTSAGSHTIGVSCGPGGGIQGVSVEVLGSGASRGGTGVASTGSGSTIPLSRAAIALIAVGGLFVAVARRRRAAAAPAA